MKIILSRKGFDSSNGGITSPIFEDGTMISFPIPSNDITTFYDLQYKGTSYTKLMYDLKYRGNMNCHIDPDLNLDRRTKIIDNWCPIFGQNNSSASYLLNTVQVEKGDIFLFFGNFHRVKLDSGTYKYVENTNNFYDDNDLQIIWGYLQVGEIITDPDEQRKYPWHPHACNERTCDKSNVMFKATYNLSLNPSMPGAGILKYDLKRVLTAFECPKATWRYNTVYDPNNILSDWKVATTDKGIYYRGIWQELGLKPSEKCTQWAKSVIVD